MPVWKQVVLIVVVVIVVLVLASLAAWAVGSLGAGESHGPAVAQPSALVGPTLPDPTG